jgi:hypothetical protein
MKKYNLRKHGETEWYEYPGSDVYEALEEYASGPEGFTDEDCIYEAQIVGTEKIKRYLVRVEKTLTYNAHDMPQQEAQP